MPMFGSVHDDTIIIFFLLGTEGEFEPDPERNFQDPAFTTFQESGQVQRGSGSGHPDQ